VSLTPHTLNNEECQFFHNDINLDIKYNGFLSFDKIGYSETFKLKKQLIARITTQLKEFVYKGISGVLGLGPSSQNNIFTDGTEHVFSLCANSQIEGGGYLVIGGIDKSMFKGSIKWIQYHTYKYYSHAVKSLTFGNVEIGNDLEAIFDTKHEFIIVDSLIAQSIKSEIIKVLCRERTEYTDVKQL
jgi:hypothetical protein